VEIKESYGNQTTVDAEGTHGNTDDDVRSIPGAKKVMREK